MFTVKNTQVSPPEPSDNVALGIVGNFNSHPNVLAHSGRMFIRTLDKSNAERLMKSFSNCPAALRLAVVACLSLTLTLTACSSSTRERARRSDSANAASRTDPSGSASTASPSATATEGTVSAAVLAQRVNCKIVNTSTPNFPNVVSAVLCEAAASHERVYVVTWDSLDSRDEFIRFGKIKEPKAVFRKGLYWCVVSEDGNAAALKAFGGSPAVD